MSNKEHQWRYCQPKRCQLPEESRLALRWEPGHQIEAQWYAAINASTDHRNQMSLPRAIAGLCIGFCLFLPLPFAGSQNALAQVESPPPQTESPPEHPQAIEAPWAEFPATFEEVALLAEMRSRWGGREPAQMESLAEAAQEYLEAYPAGRYRDEALLALANAQLALGKTAAAAASYEELADKGLGEAVNIPASNPFREYALAGAYQSLRELDNPQAATRLEDLLQDYPRGVTHNRALLWRGRDARRADDTPGAIRYLERVRADGLSQPDDQMILERELALAYVAMGRRLEAEPLFQSYLARQDSAVNRAPVLLFLAEEAREQSRWDVAREWYRQIIEDYPDPTVIPEARYRYADLYTRTVVEQTPEEQRTKARDTALALFSAYLATEETIHRERALQRRAQLHAEAGNAKLALADFDTLFAIDEAYRNEPAIVRLRVDLLQSIGQEAEAAALLESAISKAEIGSQERRGLMIEEVRLYYDQENCAAVLDRLRPLPVFDSPEHINQALFMRSFCYYREGDWERASADLEHLVRFPDYHHMAWEPLVDSYDRSGQAGRLVRFLEEDIASGRIEPTAETSHQLARGYEQLGKPEQVISTYRQLEERDPEAMRSLATLARLGRAEEAVGDAESATDHYSEALSLHPEEAPANSTYRDTWRGLQRLLPEQSSWEALVVQNEIARSVLTSPTDAEEWRDAQRTAYLGGAHANLEAKHPAKAIPQLEAALALTGIAEHELRLTTLALLAQAEGDLGRHEQAAERYETELTAVGDSDFSYQLNLLTALGALHEARGDAVLASKGQTGESAARLHYEAALEVFPEDDWESRYRVVLKVDPIYRREAAYAALIAELLTVEREVTSPVFRNKLRTYRLNLYREWGLQLLEAGNSAEAEHPFAEAMGILLSDTDWSGLAELAAARGLVLSENAQFERQRVLLRDAAARAPNVESAEQVRQALIGTEYEWARFRQRQDDLQGALAHYTVAENALEASDWRWRREITLSMAALYEHLGDRKQQTTTLVAALPFAPDEASHNEIKALLFTAFSDWGDADLAVNETDAAIAHYNAALEYAHPADWAVRFTLTQALGKIYLQRGESRALIALYQAIRDDIPDPETQRQVDRFIGQVYVQWGEVALEAQKIEFARQRYHSALTWLPYGETELRISVARALEKIYEDHEKNPRAAAAVYAELLPTIPDLQRRRQFMLYTARLYWEKVGEGKTAKSWLRSVDDGTNNALSLEAGFLLAEIDLAEGKQKAAISRLEGLENRDPDASHWRVPIRYQLAVMYHQDDELRAALKYYRRVANDRNASTQQRYPRAVAESKKQAAAIEDYLRVRGGVAGERVNTPGFINKPPTPGPKDL